MPRTKVSKNAKRNRDATARDEELAARLRDFDLYLEQHLAKLDLELQQRLDDNKGLVKLKQILPKQILEMKMSELMAMDEKTVDELIVALEIKTSNNRSMMNASLLSTHKKSRDDEGYLTEDSNSGNTNSSASAYTALSRGMTPSTKRPVGPLSSAKAKSRNRRSRSACGYLNTIGSNVSTISSSASASSRTTTERLSRSKMRTPLPHSRPKAMSVDRATPVTPKVCPNTPISMLRYPRIGETVISLTGSPVVAQCALDPTASVNIPVKNGVISLRPTRLESIDANVIDSIHPDTLAQIKELQSNLNKIMKIFDKKANGNM